MNAFLRNLSSRCGICGAGGHHCLVFCPPLSRQQKIRWKQFSTSELQLFKALQVKNNTFRSWNPSTYGKLNFYEVWEITWKPMATYQSWKFSCFDCNCFSRYCTPKCHGKKNAPTSWCFSCKTCWFSPEKKKRFAIWATQETKVW